MSRVRSKDTEPEMVVRRLLHHAGYRFRLHRLDLPGKPDIYLPRHRLAIFVHGCFWHAHKDCRRATLPKTRTEFWQAKIAKNVERDSQACRALVQGGHKVLELWACELSDHLVLTKVAAKIQGTN